MVTDDNTSAQGTPFDLGDAEPTSSWFGFDRSETTALRRGASSPETVPVAVQRVPAGTWSNAHIDRLLNTAPTEARNTDGLVPVTRITGGPGEDLTVVSLRTDAPRFQERLDFRTPPTWNESAGVALGAAEAMEKGHSLGLRHGALQARDVVIDGRELAVAGMGLSLGGTPEPDITIAPEVASSGVPTVPGDVYSLGKLLEAGTTSDSSTPEAIRELIAESTAVDPNERVASAREFADRLRAAGGDALRSYTPMSFADSPLFAAPTAIAAPVKDSGTVPAVAPLPSAAPEKESNRRRVLPWLIGAALIGLVGIGLWAATSGESDGANGTTTLPTTEPTTAPPTTEPTTAPPTTEPTTAPPTTEPTTAPPTTQPTTEPPTTQPTTEPPTTETTTTAPPTTSPPVDATPAGQAGLEILHGIPDTPVDAYLDGELLIGGFNPGEVAGPLDLPGGSYEVELFAASDDPAATAEERSDLAIASAALPVTGEPGTLVITPTASGEVQLQSFTDDLSPVAAGEGRLTIRNPGPGVATITVASVDGGAPAEVRLAPGESLTTDLPAGDYVVQIADENGNELLTSVVSNVEGSLTSATAILSDQGDAELLLQRISDLGTPPDGIPTGNSGLLPGSDGDGSAGLILAGIGALGLLALVGRQRLRGVE